MERKFKIIYVIIAVVVVFAIAGIIIFLTSGKKYDKTIFMGNTTKITIDGQKITVSNDDEKIRKQKVKVFNNNKTIDGFVTSEEIGSSDIKNNIRIYSKDKKLLSGDPYTFAYTKGLNFTIIGFNTEQLDELSDMVKIFLQNNLDIKTVKPDYFVVNSYDIDDDGLIEHVYSMGLVHGENTYESIVTMEKDGNNYLIARETANYDENENITLSLTAIADFNNDSNYEYVISRSSGESDPGSFDIYNFNGTTFNRIN